MQRKKTKRANREKMRLYAQVAANLSAKIASGEFKVGDRLPTEHDLSIEYGVSRPTVREAIIALEVDELVETVKGSGVYVISQHPKAGIAQKPQMGLMELLEARRAIESEAAAIAAKRISDDELEKLRSFVQAMDDAMKKDGKHPESADRSFHLTIAGATRNTALYDVIETLFDAMRKSVQVQYFASKTVEGGIKMSVDQHTQILEALEKRSPSLARKAMLHHITEVIKAVLEATEVETIEVARKKMKEQRDTYLDMSILQ